MGGCEGRAKEKRWRWKGGAARLVKERENAREAARPGRTEEEETRGGPNAGRRRGGGRAE